MLDVLAVFNPFKRFSQELNKQALDIQTSDARIDALEEIVDDLSEEVERLSATRAFSKEPPVLIKQHADDDEVYKEDDDDDA